MPTTDPTRGRVVVHEACGSVNADEIRRARDKYVATWTVVSAARRGDLVVLYETGRSQWFAFGRVLADAVPSAVKKRQYFTYLEVFPVLRPVSLGAMQRAAPEWRALFNQIKGQTVPAPAAQKLLRRMVKEDNRATVVLAGWAGGARWWRPSDAAVEELAKLSWSPADRPPPPDGSELKLQREIADYLSRTRRARALTSDDGVDLRHSFHVRHDDGSWGFADCVLVDLRRERTLLVLEVKKHASLARSREPVEQVIRYRNSLGPTARGWKLRAIAVCESHSDGVEWLARRRRVALWHWRAQARQKIRVVYDPRS